MRDRRPKDPLNPSQKSLQRWDNEGGATKRGHDRREDFWKRKSALTDLFRRKRAFRIIKSGFSAFPSMDL